MLLLQTQLDIDSEILKPLELFGYFVALMCQAGLELL